MKVENMTSSRGNKVANQFIITITEGKDGVAKGGRYFQSYKSIIAFVPANFTYDKVLLDEKHWDYPKSTGKYRNQFLGENKAETQAKIDSGEYILADLN